MKKFYIINEDGNRIDVVGENGSDSSRYLIEDNGTVVRIADDNEILGEFDYHED